MLSDAPTARRTAEDHDVFPGVWAEGKGQPSMKHRMDLRGVPIVAGCRPSATIKTAAMELARFLHLLSGIPSPVVPDLPSRGPAIVLDPKTANRFSPAGHGSKPHEQSYRVRALRRGRDPVLVICSPSPVGILYGVYAVLEELGMGFYAGGETYPDLPADISIPATLDISASPAFRVRGNMLHYNFLCGCTTWGLDDYRFYFDQLARMRCNMLLMHWYDNEPGAAGHLHGEYFAGGRTPSTLTKPWGATAALRTSQFSFGTSKFFDEEVFTSPAGEDLPDLLTEIKRSEAMFDNACAFARDVGIHIAAGFEAPRADPTDRTVREKFEARLRQFIEKYPHITHFALWQHESGGCVGSPPPPAGSDAARLMRQRAGLFSYLGNDQRVWEAIRFGRFAEIALQILEKEAAGLRLVLVGWGGDRWMRFADMCLGYDRILPQQVAFTCHDNIDASMGPTVSEAWGKLPAGRERWAMPWVEGDIDDCHVRQPHVESLGLLASDALAKGCQGLLTLQWRTRDVEEETGYIARFAWDTSLTPDRFYRLLARHAFGRDQEKRMARHIATLQRLGARWTGVRGTCECGAMKWTGWTPHFPFEADDAALDYLIPKFAELEDALAEVPRAADSEAAFHLISGASAGAASQRDESRPGVAQVKKLKERLLELRGRGEAEIRAGLRAIEEELYSIRPGLVSFGMTSRSYHAIDGLLIAMHHVWRNAGARKHFRILRRIRRDLEDLRSAYLRQKRHERLERLDYLANTMDFAANYDRAVMLLADNESVDRALARAGELSAAGDAERASEVAAAAYSELVSAGMKEAIEAFTRKLTTRCDFGTLATLNVKPLPLYWDTLGKLEQYMTAAPPRDLTAVGKVEEVRLSWEPAPRAAALVLRRRPPGGKWLLASRKPLDGNCTMFLDRPGRPGEYEYGICALDANGWESPMSHTARAIVGRKHPPPRLVACKPAGRLRPNEDWFLRVVAVSDRQIRSVTLRYRLFFTREWVAWPLIRRFRESWTACVPADRVPKGILEFFIEACDERGLVSRWPATAPRLPWTLICG